MSVAINVMEGGPMQGAGRLAGSGKVGRRAKPFVGRQAGALL